LHITVLKSCHTQLRCFAPLCDRALPASSTVTFLSSPSYFAFSLFFPISLHFPLFVFSLSLFPSTTVPFLPSFLSFFFYSLSLFFSSFPSFTLSLSGIIYLRFVPVARAYTPRLHSIPNVLCPRHAHPLLTLLAGFCALPLPYTDSALHNSACCTNAARTNAIHTRNPARRPNAACTNIVPCTHHDVRTSRRIHLHTRTAQRLRRERNAHPLRSYLSTSFLFSFSSLFSLSSAPCAICCAVPQRNRPAQLGCLGPLRPDTAQPCCPIGCVVLSLSALHPFVLTLSTHPPATVARVCCIHSFSTLFSKKKKKKKNFSPNPLLQPD
jgi:hypothetical protein